MIFDHLPLKKGKKETSHGQGNLPQSPVLSDDDEQFLKSLTSEALPPPPPGDSILISDDGTQTLSKEEKLDLFDGADQIPLPNTPQGTGTVEEDKLGEQAESKKWRRIVARLPMFPARVLEKVNIQPKKIWLDC